MNVIKDEQELNLFIDTVLSDLTEDECYLILFGSRKKYFNAVDIGHYVMSGSDMLKRVIVNTKKDILETLKSLSQFSYSDRNGKPFPENVYTVYITTNPRSNQKAASEVIHTLIDNLTKHEPINLERLIKNKLHKNISRKVYLDFDFDFQNGVLKGSDEYFSMVHKLKKQFKEILLDTEYHCVLTRGGVHLLVKTDTMTDVTVKRTFYNALKELDKQFQVVVEIFNDSMCPIPGCVQGDNSPSLLK